MKKIFIVLAAVSFMVITGCGGGGNSDSTPAPAASQTTASVTDTASSSVSGSLDTTFGTGGIVTTPIGSYDAYAYALAIQSDGRIVVSGYSSNGSNYDFALVRYNTDGSLDTTFGTGGIVITPMGSGYDIAYALAIQSDGRILAAGNSYNGSNYNFALVRYNTNGSLDTTFGTGGIVTTSIGTGDSEALALGIQSDGNILAAGKSPDGSNNDFALVRYNTNGSLDTTFGTGGIVTT
ncbi:MAG: delta-60 repeat domain-containing protein, partial [Smithella sp.]